MCPFCNNLDLIQKVIYQNEHVFSIYDTFPVTKGHALIITKRHIKDFFETSQEERISILDAIDKLKIILDDTYHPDGYNIGINNGESAGQTIFHLHIHLIPRYKGDTPNPKGGVRGVIPDKQSY